MDHARFIRGVRAWSGGGRGPAVFAGVNAHRRRRNIFDHGSRFAGAAQAGVRRAKSYVDKFNQGLDKVNAFADTAKRHFDTASSVYNSLMG